MISVLIVEDERDVRNVLSEMLGILGFRVKALSDGSAAWREISVHAHDLVITDLGLPGMDGIGLLKRMRLHDKMSPVLIITGVELKGVELGIDDLPGFEVIQKPFTLDDLKRSIAKLLKSDKFQPQF